MPTPRISASSYSNTAPLIWSFLYGSNHGKVELVLDNAPARSAEMLMQDRVDAALVPVIASQFIEGVRLIPGVCVGAKEKVRSVCLITNGADLDDVRSVALDASSQTSVFLTKILFREFLESEPEWRVAEPDIGAMLAESDAALLIGDPALALSVPGAIATGDLIDVKNPPAYAGGSSLRAFDLAELWHSYTGLGFVFAMWMTRRETCRIDFVSARDEGLVHLEEIAANYQTEIPIGRENLIEYLSQNVSYSIDDSMKKGMELYFELAKKNGLLSENRPIVFV